MLRLGVIGLRNIGRNHIRQSQRTSEEVRVIAGADLDSERCSQSQEEFDLDWTTTDSTELIEHPDIDGVVLALPNQLHAPLTIQALEAGKHVLVEKPICGKSSEVEGMIQARDASGKVLMVGHNQRFSPKVYALKQALKEGRFGKIYNAKTFWNRREMGDAPLQRGPWGFLEEKAGGGPMLDLGIHKLDQLLFLLDFPKPTLVSGFLSKGIGKDALKPLGVDYTVEDFATALIHCEEGLCIQVESSYYHAQKEGEIQGSIVSGTQGLIDNLDTYSMKKGELEAFDLEPDQSAPASCVEHFTRVIQGKEELQCTAEEATQALRLVEAIYLSAKQQQPVTMESIS